MPTPLWARVVSAPYVSDTVTIPGTVSDIVGALDSWTCCTVRLSVLCWPSRTNLTFCLLRDRLFWRPSCGNTKTIRILSESLRLLSTIENLYVYEDRYSSPSWKGDIENTEWLDPLLPYTAVKNLYLVSKRLTPRIALALQERTGGRTTELLPALQNVLLEEFPPLESVQKSCQKCIIARFVSARQLTNSPVAISAWHRNSHWR
jgi:hypothetical protein